MNDHGGHQQYHHQLANPVLPFCFLGNTPVCGKPSGWNGTNLAELRTCANECVALILGLDKHSDGFCPQPKVVVTSTDPALVKNALNGYKTTAPAPITCNDNFNPVCASNGVTYKSLCVIELMGATRISSGPCGSINYVPPTVPVLCNCNPEFKPICSDDNVTYQSACLAQCANVRVASQTACLRPCGCTAVLKQVCSTEMETFNNECLLKCKGKTLLYQGACPTDNLENCTHCAGYIQLVCGKNGVTYDNKCYLECAKTEFYQAGACPSNKQCKCEDFYLPVCGLDKKTYRNECLLKCTNVKKAHNGACMDEERPKQSCASCPQDDNPVCGSDGKTYQNPCKINCETGVQVAYKGECNPLMPKNCQCPGTTKYVCGSDNKTYQNPCGAKCAGVQIIKEEKCYTATINIKVETTKELHYGPGNADDNDGLDPNDPIVQYLNPVNPPELPALMKYYESLFPNHKPVAPEYGKYQLRFIKCIKAASNK